MKKIMIVLAGLLLMFTYGCGGDEERETTVNETVIESQESAADENAIETEEKTEAPDDTVKETKKKPEIEGC
jgi:hypothetical protein